MTAQPMTTGGAGVSRRRFLIGAGLGAMATGLGVAGCSTEPAPATGGDPGSAQLQMTWWGNPTRDKATTAAIAAYTRANPGVTISPQTSEFSSYWDRLATQTAGKTMPDIIQHEVGYLSEYAQRGSLLELEKYGLDLSKFAAGTTDSGQVQGKLYGVNAGLNTPILMASPAVFEKAGVELPDDTTWTWDDAMEVAAEVTAKTGGKVHGMTTFFGSDAYFGAWVRQDGKELFTEDGLGFEAADVAGWFEMMTRYVEAKALPSASRIGEEATKSLDQSALVLGTAAISPYWSNQVQSVNDASGETMRILRFPSRSGRATERQAWYKASMLWAASATTANPEAAVAVINWWVNSMECADICLAERGIPANTEVLAGITPKLSEAQQSVAQFIADIKPEIGSTPIVVPPGGSTLPLVLTRLSTEVLFGRTSARDAGQQVVDEVSSNLTT